MDPDNTKTICNSTLKEQLRFARVSFALLFVHIVALLLFCISVRFSEKTANLLATSYALLIVSVVLFSLILCFIFCCQCKWISWFQYVLYFIFTLSLGSVLGFVETKLHTDCLTTLLLFLGTTSLALVVYSTAATINLTKTKLVFVLILLFVNFNTYFVWYCFNTTQGKELMTVTIVSLCIGVYVGIIWLLILQGRVHTLNRNDYAYPVMLLYSDVLGLVAVCCGAFFAKKAMEKHKVEEINEIEKEYLKLERVERAI